MTDLEQRAIRSLSRAAMPAQGWHRGFRVFLIEKMRESPRDRLLSRQQADLWFLVWTYRRQIDDFQVVAKANEIVNGAMSLAF
jgi:hypothetical protein